MDIAIGKTPKRSESKYWQNGIHKWATIASMDFGKDLDEPAECISDVALKETNIKKVSKGTLLFSFKLTIGKMAFAGCDLYTNEAIAALTPKNGRIDKRFLFYALQVADLTVNAGDAAKGSTLNTKTMPLIELRFPRDINEQRRIVAQIEELTCRADEARRLRQEAVEELKKSLSSAIDTVFRKRAEDWTEATVKQLCGKPQYGFTESATNEQVGPRFLRITDIQNGRVDWDSVPYCSCDEIEKYRLSDGDIVFARTGATTGKSYIIRRPPEAVFASYLIRIRAGERVLPEYIWWYFQSSSYWASVFSGIDDGNRPNMNGSKLGALKIPFPKSKETQRQIVSRIEKLAEKTSELGKLQTETEADLEAFQSALLAKAFRGEL